MRLCDSSYSFIHCSCLIVGSTVFHLVSYSPYEFLFILLGTLFDHSTEIVVLFCHVCAFSSPVLVFSSLVHKLECSLRYPLRPFLTLSVPHCLPRRILEYAFTLLHSSSIPSTFSVINSSQLCSILL